MGKDQGLLGPQPIPAVAPSAVQVLQFFLQGGRGRGGGGGGGGGGGRRRRRRRRRGGGNPQQENIFKFRFKYAGWSASQSNHNCGKHTDVTGFALTYKGHVRTTVSKLR
jgi:hypothetical protein